MSQMYVAGHKNPDVDSFVSGIVFCDYLSACGKEAAYIYGGNVNKELSFVSRHFSVPLPSLPSALEEDAKIYLVDHNESSQMIDSISTQEIVGIIDHHKIGALTSTDPFFVRIEKL